MKEPLVSIMIPNYNHSRYLDQCIQSAIGQTYKNLEIIVLDNASTDDSVRVASKYMEDPRVSVNRNQFNVLNRNYYILANNLSHGKYMLLLCADDYILPDFIKSAVEIMEQYPDVAYVHGEKDLADENGNIEYWDPFYKCSFVAPGINAMPIYMVTTVGHPSQGLIRRSSFMEVRGYDKEIDHSNADKTLWFYLSEKFDAGYIKEKSCIIRVGAQTETFISQRNFQHPILCHLTIKDFVKYAKERGIQACCEREEEAMKRLALEFLDYSIGMLAEEDYVTAERYLSYSYVVSREVSESEKYKTIKSMLENQKIDIEMLKEMVRPLANKKRNYEPPKGYVELKKGIDYGK